jgi:hypothetical protein
MDGEVFQDEIREFAQQSNNSIPTNSELLSQLNLSK